MDPAHVNARVNLQRLGQGRRTAADRREKQVERQRQAFLEQVRAFQRRAQGAQTYENELARLTLAPDGMTYESLIDELDCSLVSAPYHHLWLTDEQVSDLLLTIVPGKPQLKGMIFLLRTPDGRNLLVFALGQTVRTFG